MPKPKQAPIVVWFRDDLRLADHPALHAAAEMGVPVLCIYIFDQKSEGIRPLGAASRWWLHHSLESLASGLERIGGRLDLFSGAAAPMVATILQESGGQKLVFNRRYERAEQAVDAAVSEAAESAGIAAENFIGSVVHEPTDVTPKSGGYYKVFSPYWKAALAKGVVREPLAAPDRLRAAAPVAGTVSLDDLALLPSIRWDTAMRETWVPGEAQAAKALASFTAEVLDRYPESRNQLAIDGSSRLSPHLRFGEVSPVQVFAAADSHAGDQGAADKLKAEVGWRDFDKVMLWNNPDLATKPFHADFDRFPYAEIAATTLAAWRKGRTGYPIVDAGMRQLWTTGFMHNRVRMITASFLIKHLLADWRLGEQWFWDTLCDADPANNPVNWQWIAGCGNDPVPYFRIFNPVLQGEKFDGDGTYVRRFVPEVARLPNAWIHKPWEAPKALLEEAGVRLGDSYPTPIVDHKQARARALDALRRFRAVRAPREG